MTYIRDARGILVLKIPLGDFEKLAGMNYFTTEHWSYKQRQHISYITTTIVLLVILQNT